jgi:hypothetical protein
VVVMEGDDRSRRRGVGVFAQDDRRQVVTDVLSHQAPDDELVHAEVRLVQPVATHLLRLQA